MYVGLHVEWGGRTDKRADHGHQKVLFKLGVKLIRPTVPDQLYSPTHV